jgi:3-oxoacyl-[acyl-carrier-protein] synthase-1
MSAAGPRRVVVTGMGITSCLGNTLDDVANSLKEARFATHVSESNVTTSKNSQSLCV